MPSFLLSYSLALCGVCGVVVVARQVHCPNPWSYNPGTKHCYLAVHRYSTYDQAQSDCRQLFNRSQLVTVHDDSENEFVRNLSLLGNSWIGARARFDLIDAQVGLIHPGLVLRWPNGDLVRYANWDYWNGTLEMDASRMCVIINLRGRWQNYPCTKQAHFVCKKAIKQFDRREVAEECPPRWTLNRSTHSCYLVIGGHDLTMLHAEQHCQDAGKKHGREAFLTSIVSSAENQFVHGLAKTKNDKYRPIYLGAVGNYSSPDAWTWLDGSYFSAYKNWANKMPHGTLKQAALLMDREGFWTNTYADRPVISNRRNIGVCKMSAA